MCRSILVILCFIFNWANLYGEAFVIKNYQVDVALNLDGSFQVREKITVFFTEERRGIIRSIPISYLSEAKEDGEKAIRKNLGNYYKIFIKEIAVNNHPFQLEERSPYLDIRIGEADTYISGEQLYEISYKVWGGINIFQNHTEFSWNLVGNAWSTSIEQVAFTINLPQDIVIPSNDLLIYTGKPGSKAQNVAYQTTPTQIFGKTTQTLEAGEGLSLALKLPVNYFQSTDLSIELYGDDLIIRNMETDIFLESNGQMKIKHQFQLDFRSDRGKLDFKPQIQTTYYENGLEVKPSESWFSRYFYPLINNIKYPPDDKYRLYDFSGRKPFYLKDSYKQNWDDHFWLEYEVYGLLTEKEGQYHLQIPLNRGIYGPIDNLDLRIHFPANTEIKEYSAEVLNYYEKSRMTFKSNGSTLLGSLIDYTLPAEALELHLSFPKHLLGQKDNWLQLKLWAYNNPMLLLAISIIGLLGLLWHFFGKKILTNIVHRYQVPKGITSAEAGLLWDDKLHKEDLVSLIYYWAGNGLLKIKEVQKEKDSDYTLIKLNDLPKEAKSFERTLFDGLFAKKSEVKTSTLKNTFYKTMDKAHKELEKYGKQNDFYVPGSRGFGTSLKVLGFLMIAVAVGAFVYGADRGDYSYFVPACILTLAFFLFAKLMPKKGPFGAKKYREIAGFKAFIQQAELDRLKTITESTPQYFDKTIAFAIVFGLGEHWAKKFEPLMSRPPNWYEGSQFKTFSSLLLTQRLIKSMHHFEKSFNQTPYSGSSSSGSFSSSSGSGRSSFGGGFSSGGGFGGGGGRSW